MRMDRTINSWMTLPTVDCSFGPAIFSLQMKLSWRALLSCFRLFAGTLAILF